MNQNKELKNGEAHGKTLRKGRRKGKIEPIQIYRTTGQPTVGLIEKVHMLETLKIFSKIIRYIFKIGICLREVKGSLIFSFCW